MKETLRVKCNLIAENYQDLAKELKWHSSNNLRFGALYYTLNEKKVNVDAINRGRTIIKENTGIFSQFKDITNFTTSVILSLQDQPEKDFLNTLKVYEALKQEGLHPSPYLVLAATSIAIQAEPFDYTRIVTATKDIYKAMKKEHKILTSSDDYGFAALLAMQEKPTKDVVNEVEACYRILKQDFVSSNSLQALAQVLTISEEDSNIKCKRVVDLNQALKIRKCKIGSGIERSFLGIAALFEMDCNQLADEIAEFYEYLKYKKGFGSWSISRDERVMFAIALLCIEYLEDAKQNAVKMTLSNNVTVIMIAQQMAAIAAASAAVAAASASSS